MATYNSLLAFWIGGVGKYVASSSVTYDSYLATSVMVGNYYPIFAKGPIVSQNMIALPSGILIVGIMPTAANAPIISSVQINKPDSPLVSSIRYR